MQTSRDRQSPGQIHRPLHQIEPFFYSNVQMSKDNAFFPFTLESSPSTTDNTYAVYDSPSTLSISSNPSPFSPQGSDNTYGSPLSGSSVVDNGSELSHVLRELKSELLGPDYDVDDISSSSFNSGAAPNARLNQILERATGAGLKEVLILCAEAVSEEDLPLASGLMDVLERRVSISGEPIQRLGAYLLEGLRARLLSSGSIIYQKLKCEEPTSSELMSYMGILYQICPYYKFAYTSSNAIIMEAMENEPRIHIIDFQIAQGSQWIPLIQFFGSRGGRAPLVRITGVDDSQSAHARAGGLHLVGRRLEEVAKQCGVPFEFNAAAMSGCEVGLEDLRVRPGEEAIAVNFPYMLHHMPDESVTTANHRDRLLRLIKSFSPKVVTLLEQESNTNTSPFFPRFRETLDYYTAMFESIDVARPRNDKQRINAEQHCVARDIVNMVACEGGDRVERHELFRKWRSRLMMAGFSQCALSGSVGTAVMKTLKEYNETYRLFERDGALYLGWKNRSMVTCSAWR